MGLEAHATMESKIHDLEKECRSREDMQTALKEDLDALHDLLNQERLVAAKSQVTVCVDASPDCIVGLKNELKHLTNELDVAQTTMESLQQFRNQLETENKELKIALRNQKESNRDLTKQCTKVKEKLELAVKEHTKRESELSTEMKTKLDAIKHDIKAHSKLQISTDCHLCLEERKFLSVRTQRLQEIFKEHPDRTRVAS